MEDYYFPPFFMVFQILSRKSDIQNQKLLGIKPRYTGRSRSSNRRVQFEIQPRVFRVIFDVWLISADFQT